jgi:hypothetical protein
MIKVTASQVSEGTLGACIKCKNIQEGCEPDARRYECDVCEQNTVYGLEELLIMGQIELVDEEE